MVWYFGLFGCFPSKRCTVLSLVWLFWSWKFALMEIMKYDLEIYYVDNKFLYLAGG
jgi:hypothetical protein